MYRRLLLTGCLLLLLSPACQNPGGDGQLTVAFPLETTELAGGRSLRVTISLLDRDDQPIEGARVQAELQAPGGDVFAILACDDRGQGRYLADEYVQLPLRGAGGTWRVMARATWGDGKQAQAERTFKGLPSLSEEIQNEFGFWIDVPEPRWRGYDLLWHYAQRNEDGSGYVLIDNPGHGRQRVDVHWRHADWPADEAAACAYVRDLTLAGEAEYILDPNRVAQAATFQGRPAWLVNGRLLSGHGLTAFGADIEWVIFRCPDSPHPQGAASDWVWTVAIHTTNPTYMDPLRQTRETFQCP